ncbi:hypothetical protein CDD81_4112 [Ophiocordyceps australis]|uniref:Ricin B lectin domain-containing protein n=1 Tax=Ophiocordyceps australis TaxID=1399860 RepID=A0A2C5YCR9_9HYPO|nr:hypothetical protein CDD81_4112 [Ophiocordyceps australis]
MSPAITPLGNGNDAPDIDGTYVISVWGTQRVLQQTTLETSGSSSVRLRTYDGSDVQKWLVHSNKNNELTFCNVSTGKYLNLEYVVGSSFAAWETKDKGNDMYGIYCTPLSSGGYRISARCHYQDPAHVMMEGSDAITMATDQFNKALAMGLDRVA